jgi:glutathione S-transferase
MIIESSAIMKYLCDAHNITSAYPRGNRARARVDQMMDWIGHDLFKPLINQLVLPQVLPHHRRDDSVHQGSQSVSLYHVYLLSNAK